MSLNEIAENLEKTKSSEISGKASDSLTEITRHPQSAQLLQEKMKQHNFKADAESMEYKGSETNKLAVFGALVHMYGIDTATAYWNEPKPESVRPRINWLQNGFVIPEGTCELLTIPTYRKGKRFPVALYHRNQVVAG